VYADALVTSTDLEIFNKMLTDICMKWFDEFVDVDKVHALSSGRVFMMNTRAQGKVLHAWIIFVIVKQYLVQIGRMDGPAECLS
jgi:hypothetical protein